MIREIFKMLNQYAVDHPTLPVNLRFSHLFRILAECWAVLWKCRAATTGRQVFGTRMENRETSLQIQRCLLQHLIRKGSIHGSLMYQYTHHAGQEPHQCVTQNLARVVQCAPSDSHPCDAFLMWGFARCDSARQGVAWYGVASRGAARWTGTRATWTSRTTAPARSSREQRRSGVCPSQEADPDHGTWVVIEQTSIRACLKRGSVTTLAWPQRILPDRGTAQQRRESSNWVRVMLSCVILRVSTSCALMSASVPMRLTGKLKFWNKKDTIKN